jgi:hypothetical protein
MLQDFHQEKFGATNVQVIFQHLVEQEIYLIF